MTTIQIVIAVFSSSLLAAGLTAGVNYYLTTVNYRNEYYKKLLDKRLNAYEELYTFLYHVKSLIYVPDGHKMIPYILNNGVDELDKTLISSLYPIMTSMWLSSEVSLELTRLNVQLGLLYVEAKKHDNPDQALKDLGDKHVVEIRKTRKEIERLMRIDLQTMHKIEDFVKS